MARLQVWMDRFRRASRDTFNAHFLPYAETERDHDVFASVEGAMLQVMVLDHLGVSAHTPYYRPYPQIVGKPRRAGVEGTIQNNVAAPQRILGERTRFAYVRLLDFTDDYSARELDFALVEIVEGPDADLVGKSAVVRWSDIDWIDPKPLTDK